MASEVSGGGQDRPSTPDKVTAPRGQSLDVDGHSGLPTVSKDKILTRELLVPPNPPEIVSTEVQEEPLDNGRMKLSLVSGGKEIGHGIVGADKRRPGGLYAQDYFVDEEQRGEGNGRKLLDATDTYAQAHGFSSVALEVDAKNEIAVALYGSAGYVIGETVTDSKGNVYYRMQKKLQPKE